MYDYQIVQAINTLTSYIQSYIYPLLWIILSALFSLITINILRWYRNK